jgi:phosphoenolpyruvate phosphomutase
MTMLDVNGKPLLQRQYETLNQASISQVTAVNGYKEELVDVDGVKMVSNKNWQDTGEMESIFCGAQEEYEGATLVAYSDILFDADVVDRLLKSQAAVTILADTSYDPGKYDADRRTDLVIMDAPPAAGRRSLGAAGGVPVRKIGRTLPPAEASAEFAGLALFSQEGFELLVKTYREAKEKSGAFHEAASPAKATLTDLLQELIDRGSEVTAVSVTQGWMEIHSFEDYKQACQVVPV